MCSTGFPNTKSIAYLRCAMYVMQWYTKVLLQNGTPCLNTSWCSCGNKIRTWTFCIAYKNTCVQLNISVYSAGKTLDKQTYGKGWRLSHMLASEPHNACFGFPPGLPDCGTAFSHFKLLIDFLIFCSSSFHLVYHYWSASSAREIHIFELPGLEPVNQRWCISVVGYIPRKPHTTVDYSNGPMPH